MNEAILNKAIKPLTAHYLFEPSDFPITFEAIPVLQVSSS